MPDPSHEETSRLEKLLAARRDEISSGQTGPSKVEPDLLDAALAHLMNERHTRNSERSKKQHEDASEDRLRSWAVVAPFGALLFGFLVAAANPSLVGKLQWLAGAAAVIGIPAAFLRVWAHNGSKALDGAGKALGLCAATLAGLATIALLALTPYI